MRLMSCYTHSNWRAIFEDHLTKLYTVILEFQFRALCYLRRNTVIKSLGGAFDYERWAGTLDGIRGP